jgi:acyl dehydratase
MNRPALTFDNVGSRIGEEIGLSDWFTVRQEQVDRFADATLDPDWIHVDPERAAREGPFGQAVAHGFLTLSMLSHFAHDADLWPADTAFGVNYGLDKARFIAPVPVGARIRAHFVLKDFARRDDGGYVMTTAVTVEIEGAVKPALAADWLALYYPAEPRAADSALS